MTIRAICSSSKFRVYLGAEVGPPVGGIANAHAGQGHVRGSCVAGGEDAIEQGYVSGCARHHPCAVSDESVPGSSFSCVHCSPNCVDKAHTLVSQSQCFGIASQNLRTGQSCTRVLLFCQCSSTLRLCHLILTPQGSRRNTMPADSLQQSTSE